MIKVKKYKVINGRKSYDFSIFISEKIYKERQAVLVKAKPVAEIKNKFK